MQTTTPAWRVIAWMCAAHVASMAGFSTYATLLPRLQVDWQLNNAQAGLISGMFFAGYMAAVPVLTSLTDRIDARRIYLASSVVTAASLLAMAWLARDLFTAAACQLLAGAGVAGTYMPGLRALTDNVSGTAQGRAVSFYTAVFGLGTSISILMSGVLAEALGWRWAFGLSALGPAAAGLMVILGMPSHAPRHAHAAAHVLDFRPVLRAPEVRPYIFGYAWHCWELFGSRSWLVAFLVFAQSRLPAGETAPLAPIAVAAVANLLAPVSSILGNEAAMRGGRERVIWRVMLASGLLTCTLGFAAALTPPALMLLAWAHMCLVMGDSSALTAGVVARADERIRGATMAVHSMLGFGAGFVSPLLFGMVLDLAGGRRGGVAAWGLAFFSLGVGAVGMSWFIRRRVVRA
jgi:MFS family permease